MAVRALKTSETTGICITASHNPARDNGVKLSEPTGEMLQQSWEPYANALARAEDDEALAREVRRVLDAEGVVPPAAGGPAVLLARDTRASGPRLVAAAAAGAAALGCSPVDLGELTTPQLHWAVSRHAAGLPFSREAYGEELCGAFAELVEGAAPASGPLLLDCANGVGAAAVRQLAPSLRAAGLEVELRAVGDGELNGRCGADYVQKSRSLPAGSEGAPAGGRCASLDGDADRVVYWTAASAAADSSVRLLDGDKIASLAAILVARLARDLPEALRPSVGVVQTAYANGASSDYLRDELGLEVLVTPTGVKHLHAAAHRFDVGIYFEANGHGTVLFSRALLARLREAAPREAAARRLLALSRAVNQTVGDAISGVLLVEAALRVLGWSLGDWEGIYADLPSRQLVVRVPDRTLVKTTDAERRVASPPELQAAVDAALRGVPRGRAFVRPSGTEDIVRVYAEAATPEATEALAASVADAVRAVLG